MTEGNERSRDENIMSGCVTIFGILFVVVLMIGQMGGFGGGSDSSESGPSNAFAWTTYDVTIDVQPDGVLRVTESQVIEFNSEFSEGFLEIPMTRIESIDNVRVQVESQGTLDPDNYLSDGMPGDLVDARDVTRRGGLSGPETFTAQREGDLFVIEYGFHPTGYYGAQERRVNVTYDVHGAMRVYPDAEEPWEQFHWMAIASDVTNMARVSNASVTINLPEAPPDGTLVVAPDADVIEGTTIRWERASLAEGEACLGEPAFAVQTSAEAPAWQPEADANDEAQEQKETRRNAGRTMLLLAGIGTGVLGGLGLLWGWFRGMRETTLGPVPDRLEARPDDLPAGLVGSLVDEKVQPRDIAATIVDLALRGIVRFDAPGEGGGGWRLTTVGDVASLEPWERTILERMFAAIGLPPNASVPMTSVANVFQGDPVDMQNALDDALVERGYYAERPADSRRRWDWLSKAFAVIGIAAAMLIMIWSGQVSVYAAIPAIAGVAVWFIAKRFTPHMAVKTALGSDMAARWRAYGAHLQDSWTWEASRAESASNDDRIALLTAFGHDARWVNLMMSGGKSATPPRPSRAYAAEEQGSWGSSRPEPVSTWTWGEGGSSTRRDDTPPTWRWGEGSSTSERPVWRSGGDGWSPSIPDWGGGVSGDRWGGGLQGTSDSLGQTLQSGSSSMFEGIGDLLAAIGESSGDSDGGGGGGRSSWGGGSSSSGGGRSSSSSGGGSRGFR